MAVELLSDGGGVLDLGGDSEAERRERANLPQQCDQSLSVVHVQLTVSVVQLHQLPVRLQTEWTILSR